MLLLFCVCVPTSAGMIGQVTNAKSGCSCSVQIKCWWIIPWEIGQDFHYIRGNLSLILSQSVQPCFDVVCSRRPGNREAMSRHSAEVSQHNADANRHSADVSRHSAGTAVLDSTNHVDASLKTCVESLSAVRRLHKDLASHIEVSSSHESNVCLCQTVTLSHNRNDYACHYRCFFIVVKL